MIGQQVRMEYMQQVGQYDFRLGRILLITLYSPLHKAFI